MKKEAAPKPKRGAAKPKAAKAARRKKAAPKPENPAAVQPDPPAVAAQLAPNTPSAETDPSSESGTGEGEALSPKHEKFAQCLALGMSQIASYRAAISSSAKPSTAYPEASRLADDPKIAARVDELRRAARAEAEKAFRYEYQDAMRELGEAYKVALILGDSSAMSKAVMGKVEISGLKVDPRSNARDPFEGVTDAELEEQTQRAAKEAGVVIQPGGGPLH